MRRALVACLCTLLTLVAPAAARAQDFFTLGLAPGKLISDVMLPATVSGEIGVSFHGDPASGCTALGVCAYSGSIAWNPLAGGGLDVVRYRQGRHVHVLASLTLGSNAPIGEPLTAATVHRLVGGTSLGTCTDEQPGPPSIEGSQHGSEVTFALTDALSSTRCAGPLPSDLANVVPRATVATSALRRGNVTLDFRARRSFAGHGFAGTLTSRVLVRIHRPLRQPPEPQLPANIPSLRVRIVSESLGVGALTGSLRATVAGGVDPDVCGPLDSCGLTGTLTITPKVRAPEAMLAAIGPASRPYRDFLAALGLSRSGRGRGIDVVGSVFWTDPGSIAAVVHQGGSCTDRGGLGGGEIDLAAGPRTISLGYSVGGLLSPGPGGGGVRTRCPGPMLGQSARLASGTLSRASLGHRTFVLRLRGGGSVADQGYNASLGGAIALRIRRGRVSQQVLTF